MAQFYPGSPGFPYYQCPQPCSTVADQPSLEDSPVRVDSPIVAAGMEIPVELYNEEVEPDS